MPTIVDRDKMVRLLGEEFASISELCASLDDAEWEQATCLPGWSVKDQLSHMAGTEQMLAGRKAPEVAIIAAEYIRNDIGKANEIWVEASRSLPGSEVLKLWADVTTERLAALQTMTQEGFDAPSWTPAGPNESYGRFMRIRHFDCYMHEHDIRVALGLSFRSQPDHIQSCLDEVATALGFIVGRRARLPVGTSVAIQLTGAVETQYFVEIPERAQVVARLSGEPTTSLTMPADLWLRLTGGRQSLGPTENSEVVITGDAELGWQLATNLAFTI